MAAPSQPPAEDHPGDGGGAGDRRGVRSWATKTSMRIPGGAATTYRERLGGLLGVDRSLEAAGRAFAESFSSSAERFGAMCELCVMLQVSGGEPTDAFEPVHLTRVWAGRAGGGGSGSWDAEGV